jgi:ABC-type antimicrobial peptide transport system permease subunit
VTAALFRRTLTQVGLGILIGLVLLVGMLSNGMDAHFAGVFALYGCGILATTSLAVVGPVRRALRVQPIDALRAE